jgi:hypothetical protein
MVRRSNGHYVPFIVLPQCATIGELKGADALTYALSHELIEAATDPFATGWLTSAKDLAWKYILIGGEAGDLCEVGGHSIRVDELDAVVQRSWSNAAAAAGHEPCVPAGDAVGFGAFAATPDTYKDATTTYSTIKLPMGESRAIDVSIYSDAPMSDLKIYAWDGAAMNGRKTELQLSFPNDKAATHGKNGDVIPLIVKAVNPGSFNGMSVLTIVAESPDGRTQKLWAGLVTH